MLMKYLAGKFKICQKYQHLNNNNKLIITYLTNLLKYKNFINEIKDSKNHKFVN